jgi:copper chaperone NosL
MRLREGLLGILLLAGLAACEPAEEAKAPAPQELTREAIGHYCNMIVADHLGPKAQIHLADREAPLWFSSARDAIAFTLLPEEPKNVTAIYVNDMGQASWDAPEADTWIDAKTAWYVLGSAKSGGMGAPEAVPFKDQAAAESFVAEHGGRVVAFSEIPSDYILAAVETPMSGEGHDHGAGQAAGQGTQESMSHGEAQGHGVDDAMDHGEGTMEGMKE